MTRHLPPLPFGTTMMGADQLEWLLCITLALKEFINLIFNAIIMFHSDWIWFLQYRDRSASINLHFHQICHAIAHFVLHKFGFVGVYQFIQGALYHQRQMMQRGGECVWLNFIIQHHLCGDTIYRCLRHLVSCGLHMSDALSFIKGYVFISITSYHYIHSGLSFDIVNAIKNMNVGFIPFLVCWLLIKYATWSCKLWPLNLIGILPLCMGRIFSIELIRAMLCRSSLFLVYARKELSLCTKRCLPESQQ